MKTNAFGPLALTASVLAGLTSASVLAPKALASPDESLTLSEISAYSDSDSGAVSQVTSVSQLSDVQPTDWAFQALQNLIARYGCIAGYPDGTFRGFTALSRYEFAAGLNACLNNITANLDQIQLNQQDIATLNRLQQQFAADLATLRGRVDSLEARTAELEANQFSTTTKLNGVVIFAQEFAIDEDEDFDNQATFGYRARLNFDTSFTGEDRLRTRLQAIDLPEFEGDPLGRAISDGEDGGSFVLDQLAYTFPLGPAEINVAANAFDIDDFVSSTISPLDDTDLGTISDFGFPQQYLLAAPSDAGIGANIALNEIFSIDVAYSAGDPESPEPGSGLFNGAYSALGQINALGLFGGKLDAAFTYINAFDPEGDFRFSAGDGPAIGNTYAGQFNLRLFDNALEVGGGVGFADITGVGAGEDFEIWTYQGTLAVNDLLGEGNQLGVVAGVIPYTADLGDDDTSFAAEVFYRYRINDNIFITPSIVLIDDPDDGAIADFDDSIIGNLRTTFLF
ncbi:MAG: iron uptake porin [Elainellaceae cyanobacterium]